MNKALKTTALGLAFAASVTGCGVIEYSNGYRDGEVTKFSQKGFIFKTNEGELAMSNLSRGGALNSNSSISNTFTFSVRDGAVAKQLTELQPGTQVRLHYKQVLWPLSFVQESEYLVTKVDAVGQQAQQQLAAPLNVPKQPAPAPAK